MDMKKMNRTHKLALSGMVMAVYIVVMYLTQSFAFLQYQVRIATAIYALAYLFPFLVLPLGISNLLSNLLMGGLGVLDIVGGGGVGSFAIRYGYNRFMNDITLVTVVILLIFVNVIQGIGNLIIKKLTH